MRGWLTAAAIVGVLVVTGCDKAEPSSSADQKPKEPALVTPTVGACDLVRVHIRDGPKAGTRLKANYATDCAQKHLSETIHIGTIASPVTSAPSSAAPSSATPVTATPSTGPDKRVNSLAAMSDSEREQVRGECEAKATDHLGGDLYTARVDVQIVLPPDQDWTAGARWYACELTEEKGRGESSGVLVERTGSMKDGLKGDAPLRIQCAKFHSTRNDDDADYLSCDEPHHLEFLGAWTHPAKPGTAYPGRTKLRVDQDPECTRMMDALVGAHRKDVNWHSWGPWNQRTWERGSRVFVCFGKAQAEPLLKRSLKGIGTGVLPK